MQATSMDYFVEDTSGKASVEVFVVVTHEIFGGRFRGKFQKSIDGILREVNFQGIFHGNFRGSCDSFRERNFYGSFRGKFCINCSFENLRGSIRGTSLEVSSTEAYLEALVEMTPMKGSMECFREVTKSSVEVTFTQAFRQAFVETLAEVTSMEHFVEVTSVGAFVEAS